MTVEGGTWSLSFVLKKSQIMYKIHFLYKRTEAEAESLC